MLKSEEESLEFRPQIKIDGKACFLFDAAALDDPGLLFDPQALAEQGLITGRAAGRGEAWFFHYGGRDLVLRHFRRGGVIGKFLNDQYLGWNPENSRSWREWRLLQRLHELELPVPRPVAAGVQLGPGFYRADLITCRIPEAVPLAARLAYGPLSPEIWMHIGMTIARFHQHGVYHADLNASNILLSAGEVFLLDFDRGELRRPGGWQQENLDRLLRSLRKFREKPEPFHFSDPDWELLLCGYRKEADMGQSPTRDAVHS